MQKRVLFYTLGCLLSFNVLGQYTYEANQDLFHLQTNANNFEGELAYEVSDDGISPAIDLSFNFTFYGSTFTQAIQTIALKLYCGTITRSIYAMVR